MPTTETITAPMPAPIWWRANPLREAIWNRELAPLLIALRDAPTKRTRAKALIAAGRALEAQLSYKCAPELRFRYVEYAAELSSVDIPREWIS